jgi:hypothetical protein
VSERALFPEEIVGLLADPIRMKVVGALSLGDADLSQLSATVASTPRDLGEAITRLADAGVIARSGATCRLNTEIFGSSVRAAAALHVDPPDDERALLFRKYFARGRLIAFPERPDPLHAVLALIAGDFAVGETYDEVSVNAKLSVWFDDWCSLRRLLVDQGFLDRDHGLYWRTDNGSDGTTR